MTVHVTQFHVEIRSKKLMAFSDSVPKKDLTTAYSK